jgi:hypothetical protein
LQRKGFGVAQGLGQGFLHAGDGLVAVEPVRPGDDQEGDFDPQVALLVRGQRRRQPDQVRQRR